MDSVASNDKKSPLFHPHKFPSKQAIWKIWVRMKMENLKEKKKEKKRKEQRKKNGV